MLVSIASLIVILIPGYIISSKFFSSTTNRLLSACFFSTFIFIFFLVLLTLFKVPNEFGSIQTISVLVTGLVIARIIKFKKSTIPH